MNRKKCLAAVSMAMFLCFAGNISVCNAGGFFDRAIRNAVDKATRRVNREVDRATDNAVDKATNTAKESVSARGKDNSGTIRATGKRTYPALGVTDVNDLHYKWMQSTATIGYFYKESSFSYNQKKQAIDVDICLWQPSKNVYFLEHFKIDYLKGTIKPSKMVIYQISDGQWLEEPVAITEYAFKDHEIYDVTSSYFRQFLKY